MYTPRHYQMDDRSEMLAFMRRFSFATVITVKDNFQTATHLPFVVEERGDEIILISHLAKANQQWKELENHQVLVIFSGPHAYISPRFYEKKQSVPTWNYLSVHAYGKGKIVDGEAGAFEVLEKTIVNYETAYKSQWDELADDYKQKLVKGIVAFSITVDELQGKKKLAQSVSEAEQQNIIHAFSESEHENEREIAAYMAKNQKKA